MSNSLSLPQPSCKLFLEPHEPLSIVVVFQMLSAHLITDLFYFCGTHSHAQSVVRQRLHAVLEIEDIRIG